MPVRAGQLSTPPPSTPTTPIPPRVRDAPRMSWFPPDGSGEVPLTTPGLGWKLLRGVTGIGAMPVTLTTDKLPRGGARVRNVRREHREFELPVRFYGRNHTEFTAHRDFLTDKITQTDELGPGTLVVWRPDGSMRQTAAYYVEGLDDTEDGWIAENAVITFMAEEPWWYGPDEEEDERIEQAAGGSFLAPYPNVASSKRLGATEIVNPGQLTAYPTWTITGPASAVTITHDDTGQSFTLDPNYAGHGDLLAGETITVQTDPMLILGPDGSAWTGALNWPGATLFGLRPGLNKISFTLIDAAIGAGVAWSYKPRFRRS